MNTGAVIKRIGVHGEECIDSSADCLLIPAVAEAQDRLIGRHDIQEGVAGQPSAHGCFWAVVVAQPSLFELALECVILTQRYDCTMTSTSRVARTGGLAASVTRSPVIQPPTNTNR
jgi:hypothetical protein